MPEQIFSNKSPRRTALDILLRRGGDTPLPVLLSGRFNGMSSRDKAFCTELVYGVLRNQGRLLVLLRPFAKKPGELPELWRQCLLLAAYELLFLHTPDHAVLSEYVGMVRKRFGARLAGLLNGILRAVTRERAAVLEQDASLCRRFFDDTGLLSAPEPAVLADFCGVDSFFAGQLAGNPHAREILWSAMAAPSPCYRLSAPGSQENWMEEKFPWLSLKDAALKGGGKSEERETFSVRTEIENFSEDADSEPLSVFQTGGVLLLQGRHGASGSLINSRASALLPLVEKGEASRQGVGSQIFCRKAADILRAHSVSWVWDACCGRGGKSLALMREGVVVGFASDPSRDRLDDFERECGRLRLRVPPHCAAAFSEAAPFLPARPAPAILLDAPCTGSGTLGRNPELRFRISADRLAASVATQALLLRESWPVLASGGLLLYATCSVFSAENQDQISGFLAEFPDAECLAQEALVPPCFAGSGSFPASARESLRGHDCLFYAVLRRK